VIDPGACDRQAELERHIEPRCGGLGAIQLDQGEVMDRIRTASDEIENLVHAVLAARNLDGGSRPQIDMSQS
jgi:hypothetical protein